MSFDDKVVIVTGGATGIGLATCLRFGRDGARVVVADHKPEHAARAAEQLRGAGVREAMAAACDGGRLARL